MKVFALWIGVAMAAMTTSLPLQAAWWDTQVEASLDRAPAQKAQWEQLLEKCPLAHRTGLAYLLRYLPLNDLKTMKPDALAENVSLAYQARSEVAWGPGLPEAVFLDAVLPHVSVTEPRDSMRSEFHDRYWPLVRDCKTPGQAALAINKKLFIDYKVRYNTRRLRTDQNAKESIAQGMATCTGLSIMLVEACRSVAVPARLAGIASWPGRGGNHTWVEIWNNGGWHFVGAAEPDDKGLDHAWFVDDTSRAKKLSPQNAIYAVNYQNRGEFFPLVWAPTVKMPAENVTDRYAKNASAIVAARPRLMFEVRDETNRVEADITIIDLKTAASRAVGSSLGPQADINRHLTCEAPPGDSLLVVARRGGRTSIGAVSAADATGGDTLIRLNGAQPVSDEARTEIIRLLTDRFGTEATRRATAVKILAELPWDPTLRDVIWSAYKASPAHDSLRLEFEAKTVATTDRKSPYLWRHVGKKPAAGWGLVIALHGGGGVAASFNDKQWHGMFERYRDHPEAGGYVYLALRAPNDEWNGFYDDAICPLVARLIRQFVILGDVNPDQVCILGASHGGYGAFVIGPKMPDRFTGIHASAAAPTPEETRGENLRNVRFTFMVGEQDTAYGRAARCLEFESAIQGWRARYGGYAGRFEWLPGVGHQVPDHDKLAEMLTAGARNSRPRHLVWAQSDDVLKHFFWIEAPHPSSAGRIEATVKDNNTIELTAEHQDQVVVWLDAPLVDLTRPVSIHGSAAGVLTVPPRASVETFCESLENRGDPRLAAPARVVVDLRR